MINDAHSTNANGTALEPWYRQGWPWFLISIPFTSVLLGFLMLYLGLNTNNSLVVDDYYKQGKSINQRIERDRSASLLGLNASITESSEGLVLDLKQVDRTVPASLYESAQRLREEFTIPDQLRLRFVHVTQASKDLELDLEGIGNGRFVSPMATLPERGRWRIHVEPVSVVTLKVDGLDSTVSSSDNANSLAMSSGGTSQWRLVGNPTIFGSGREASLSAREPKDVFNHQMLN